MSHSDFIPVLGGFISAEGADVEVAQGENIISFRDAKIACQVVTAIGHVKVGGLTEAALQQLDRFAELLARVGENGKIDANERVEVDKAFNGIVPSGSPSNKKCSGQLVS